MPRALAAAIASAVMSLANPAHAAAVDYSDLWWNPSESGWGAGITRQGDVIFLTLFVYGADGVNTWFVAPAVALQGPDELSSSWSGVLYRATGPAFSAAFDGNVQSTIVGTASLEFASATAGTLRYSVNGVQVAKQISRMTWREPSATGRYYGGFSARIPQCADPDRVGIYDFLGNMNVTHAGGHVTLSVVSISAGLPSTCNFTGDSRSSGRFASFSGTFACTIVVGLDGRGEAVQTVPRRGTFAMDRVSITANGFHGAFNAADQDCAFAGYFGGTRLP
jgi:hypothetical protein